MWTRMTSKGWNAFFLFVAVALAANMVLAPILFFVTLSQPVVIYLALADIVVALVAVQQRRYDVASGIVAGALASGFCLWLLLQFLLAALMRSLSTAF